LGNLIYLSFVFSLKSIIVIQSFNEGMSIYSMGVR